MLNKFERALSKIEIVFVCFGLLLLIVTVFLAAVLRFFGIDMSVSTDLAQLTFAWVTFIGADLAMRQNRHMGVDMLVKRFSLSAQNAILLFNYILITIFLVICIVYGFNLSIVNAARKYNTLYISYSWATVSCPIGCCLMLITSLKRVFEFLRNLVRKDYSSLTEGVSNA